MEKIEVTTRAELDTLRKADALTLEGLSPDEESLTEFLKWVKKTAGLKNEKVYIITGRTMNYAYRLTGTNRYPDDVHIVCINLDDVVQESMGRLAIARFDIGARWFSDVVDNNLMREGAYEGDEE